LILATDNRGQAMKSFLNSSVSLQKNSGLVLIASSSPLATSRASPAQFYFAGNTVLPFASSLVSGLPSSNNNIPVQRVIIAEVCPGISSANEEYVELFNPNAVAVDLANWQLRKKTEGGADSALVSKAKFIGVIKPGSYFSITDPDYQNKFKADLVWSSAGYSISEKNTISLLDNNGVVMDEVTIPSDLNSACISRTSPSENTFIVSNSTPHNSQSSGGFQKPVQYVSSVSPSPQVSISSSPQSSYVEPSPTVILSPSPVPTPTPELSPEPSPSPSPTPALVHPSIAFIQFGIEGNANADFIELYNSNSVTLDLTEYKLVKKTGSGSEYTIKSWGSSSVAISGKTYFYWVNSSYTDKINELINQGVYVATTTATITDTNGIALKYQDTVVDSRQW
jgi:hypothetical protein